MFLSVAFTYTERLKEKAKFSIKETSAVKKRIVKRKMYSFCHWLEGVFYRLIWKKVLIMNDNYGMLISNFTRNLNFLHLNQ